MSVMANAAPAQTLEDRGWPPRDRAAHNEYARKYMAARYVRVRAEVVALLGGKCARCGASEKLQIDHRDRQQKVRPINAFFYGKRDKLLDEIKKCQLLCAPCHQAKTTEERGYHHRGEHGTCACYDKQRCRCAACREANAVRHREYARRRRMRMAQS
jgi:hypothetical protein